MKTIIVKKVKAPSGAGAVALTYYREASGKPLLTKQSDGWAVCSKDGEPSYLIDENRYKIFLETI